MGYEAHSILGTEWSKAPGFDTGIPAGRGLGFGFVF